MEYKSEAARVTGVALRQRADELAVALSPVISHAVENGAKNAPQIADYLTERGILTPKGGRIWNDRHVYAILKRLKRIADTKDAGAE